MGRLTLTAVTTLTAFAMFTTGCNGDAPRQPAPQKPQPPMVDPNPTMPGTGPDGEPVPSPEPPPPPPPKPADYEGTYDTVTSLDFTQNGVLPGIVGPTLGSLSELHDHPGAAILNILENGNIPYLSNLLMQVPSILVDTLADLLDKLIINQLYKGYPVLDQVTSVIQGITEISKKLDIHDHITLHPPAAGGTLPADQEITGVGFFFLGNTHVAAIPAAAVAGAKASTPGTLKAHANAPIADADVTLGDATFSLPYGTLLLDALGPLLFTNFGGAMNLGGALKNLVPCGDFGQSLSDATSGALDPMIGKQLCEGALDVVATAVEGEIAKLTLDGIKVTDTTGQLYDANMAHPAADHQSDRLADGKWNWTFTVNGGSAKVPATFAGDRL